MVPLAERISVSLTRLEAVRLRCGSWGTRQHKLLEAGCQPVQCTGKAAHQTSSGMQLLCGCSTISFVEQQNAPRCLPKRQNEAQPAKRSTPQRGVGLIAQLCTTPCVQYPYHPHARISTTAECSRRSTALGTWRRGVIHFDVGLHRPVDVT
jgi:hypothetical protein